MISHGESWPAEFIAIFKMQEQQDQIRDDAVIAFLKSGTLPTPDHIQADINRSVGDAHNCCGITSIGKSIA